MPLILRKYISFLYRYDNIDNHTKIYKNTSSVMNVIVIITNREF